MRITATRLAEIDSICDYIPFLCPLTNLVDLFAKCVYKCLPESTTKNRYWTHIHEKSLFRCLILLIPVIGWICVLIHDYREYKVDKRLCALSVQSVEDSKRSIATMQATQARLLTGALVSAEEMMPAPTEDQQRLWAGCLGNDFLSVREQLDKGISPNFYHAGNRPLVTACQYGSVALVHLLIDKGAEVATADRYGVTPFMAACTKGKLEIVQLLHPYILDIDASGPKGVTPLMLASSNGHQNVVGFLVDAGADSRKKAEDKGDAVSNAVFRDHVELLPLLFAPNENVDERVYQFAIPSGIFFFPPTIVKDLTPLLYASLMSAEKSAIYLIGRSNVRHVDSFHNNALYFSVKCMGLLQALLAACHDSEFVNNQNELGLTALHQALTLEQKDAALLLLQNGADPFIQDGKKSAIRRAVASGTPLIPDLVEMVVEYEVSEKDNKEGKIPLILACEKGLDEVVAYIQEHYGPKITPAIQEQMDLARQHFQAKNAQPPVEQKKDLLSSALNMMQTGLDMMQRSAESRAAEEQEILDLGPVPCKGRELLFGKLPWPA